MSSAMKLDVLASKFDLPMDLLRAEQRLAERALRQWLADGQREIAGFSDHGLLVADPGGCAEILRVADGISRTFGLCAGQRLALDSRLPPHGLGMELRAACDLVALGCRPMPFEASLSAPGHGLILARGVALPVTGDRVQVVMSWREVLNRSAAARLRRELERAIQALAQAQPDQTPAAMDALPLGRQPQREDRP